MNVLAENSNKLNFDDYAAKYVDQEMIERFLARLMPRLNSISDLSALYDWLTEQNGGSYEDAWDSVGAEHGAWIFWSMPKRVETYGVRRDRGRYAFSFGLAAHCLLDGKVTEAYVESERLEKKLTETGVNRSTWMRHAMVALEGLEAVVAKVADSDSFFDLCDYLYRLDVIRSAAGGNYTWYRQMGPINEFLRADAAAGVDATLTTDAARWHWFGSLLARVERKTIEGEFDRVGDRLAF